MEKRCFNTLMLLLIGFFSAALQADSKTFKIELVVFAQDMPNSEVFDQVDSEIEWPTRLADLGSYQQVAAQYRSLSGIYAKLERTPGYRPLLHVAWTQEIKADRLGAAVQIQSPDGSLNGYFRLQRGHYLHMVTDLEYSPEGWVIYRLNEKRRFKLNEIHYLDHPKFGVIARISPLS
ncbi:CsiV family protein [Methylomarinum sp. Ch1-1]|uniref:CsiV family protein n=1 Tax=Methylomarinum roseum TaxID=3067653 RepID=A0AAU7NTX2_9GAMM|nr:CsiV family protein [Methylomarinum sp. Ch1-1]MDP4519485.1 CsiV family protein [Methylomarinum sp. Ch1-1]